MNKKLTISSLKFSKDFGLHHKNVLRTIRGFKCSKEFNERNFELVEYMDAKGEKRPMYEITQQGFTFLISRTSGRINDQYVEMYINAYEEMAQQLSHEESSLHYQLNQFTLQYMYAEDGASNAGRDLQHLGKKVKPELRRKIQELMDKIQLKLPLLGEFEA